MARMPPLRLAPVSHPAGPLARARRRATLFALALALGAVTLLAPAPPARAAGSGSISGTVSELAGSKGPLKGIEVLATRSGGGEPVRRTETKKEGLYTLNNLPVGEYIVEFRPHEPSTQNFAPRYYDERELAADADPVDIEKEGESKASINAAMQEGGVIEGAVGEKGGASGLEGIAVKARNGSGEERFEATTTAGGRYRIQGLPSGSYTVEFEPPGERNLLRQWWESSATEAGAKPVHLDAGELVAHVDAELEVGGEVSGTVSDALTKQHLQGIGVRVFYLDGEAAPVSAETNEAGEYTLRGLASGSYKICFEEEVEASAAVYLPQYYNEEPTLQTADPVEVVQGKLKAGIDAALTPVSNLISGTVSEAAGAKGALEEIEVIATRVGGSGRTYRTFSKKAGTYRLKNLPLGEYLIEFRPTNRVTQNFVAQYYDEQESAAMAAPVAIRRENEHVTGVNAALNVGGVVEGDVSEAETANGLEGIAVLARNRSGEEVEAKTTAGGNFKIQGLGTGGYTIEFLPSFETNLVRQWWERSQTEAGAKLVNLKAGEVVSNVNAELQAGGEVSGIVSDALTGKRLPGITVRVLYPDGEEAPVSAETNEAGEYGVRGLAGGSYKLRFEGGLEEGAAGHLPQYFDDQPTLQSADAVAVVPKRDASGIDAALLPVRPANRSAPVASGTPLVGDALSCSSGAWTGAEPLQLSYQWLRDGSVISAGSSYIAQADDAGHLLECEVVATSKWGRAAARSNSLAVRVAPAPPPSGPAGQPPPPAKPRIALASASKLTVSRGVIRVRLSCSGAPCAGSARALQRVRVRQRTARGAAWRTRTVLLASGSYSLRAGQGATISMRLTASGRQQLARAGGHRLACALLISLSGGDALQRQLALAPAVHA